MGSDSPKKSLGQHWLNDQASLGAIVEAAEVKTGDTVLEIGPGQGSLTAVLVTKGAEVIALEIDQSLIEELKQKFGYKIKLVQGDVRKFNLKQLPANYKLVANIPYYLTANLLRLLTETPNKPAVTSLLIQKEVAERVAAQPGQMAFLSVAVQFFYEVRLGPVVPANLFLPPPKVDSQVLILKRRNEPLLADVEATDFLRLVKAGFAQPRKTLLNNLSSGLHLSREETAALCERAEIEPSRRAQTLSLEEWNNLYQVQHLTR